MENVKQVVQKTIAPIDGGGGQDGAPSCIEIKQIWPITT